MKTALTLIFGVVLIFLANSNASAFYCKNKLVQEGLTKGEVRSLCGEPAFEDRRDEDRVEKPDNGNEDIVIRVTVDEWMYNFGPDKFIQVLIFEKGRLQKIIAGEYGWVSLDENKMHCPSLSLLLGASKSEIFVKCGKPDEKNSWQKSFKSDNKSRSNKQIKQTFEEWTYHSVDGKELVFKFTDGRLVSVNTMN